MRERRIRGVQDAREAGDRRQDGARTWRKRGDGVRMKPPGDVSS